MRVAILGSGAYGTSLAKVLAEIGHTVQLWTRSESFAQEINETHTNQRYLPQVSLPPNLKVLSDPLETIKGSEILILAVPSYALLQTIKRVLSCEEIVEGKIPIATMAKGFIQKGGEIKLSTHAIEDYLPGTYKGNTVYISGPSHAEEIARGKITALTAASNELKNPLLFRKLFKESPIRIFPSLDVVGVQVCAAIKNIIAIAFGILDASSEKNSAVGDNTESFLFAAGLNEIQTLGNFMGATHPETFTSIAGVGDLHVTCRSQYGRNRKFGSAIVKEKILEPFHSLEELIEGIERLPYLPEGVFASFYVNQLISKKQIKIPIIKMVYQILNREITPEEAISLFIEGTL